MSFSFFNFSNLDLIQYDAIDLGITFDVRNLPQMNSKDPNYISTAANDDVIAPNSRSKKTCLNPFESSFQCNFSYEHMEALNKKTQNFMEAISSCSQKIQIQELRARIIQNVSSYISSCDEIIDLDHCDIKNSEKSKFKTDLRFEKKLKEFLDEISKKFVPEVAGELLAISNFVWLQYTKVMEERFTEYELISWAKNLAESKFKEYRKMLEKTKEICFKEDEGEVFPNFDQAIKEFMNFYFVTIVLCVEQFFENPYFQEEKEETNSFKRRSSNDDCYSFDQFSELQEDIYGSKKLKF